MQPLKTILNNSYTDNISDGGCGGTNFPSVFVIIKTGMFLKRGAEMVGRRRPISVGRSSRRTKVGRVSLEIGRFSCRPILSAEIEHVGFLSAD